MAHDQPISMAKPNRRHSIPPRRGLAPAGPCAMVIFGASGDLTRRLLVPALYNLARTKLLPANFALIAVARAEETTESWREQLYQTLKGFIGNSRGTFSANALDESAWQTLAAKMQYVRGDLGTPELYPRLKDALADADRMHGTGGNAVFYLAIADQFFGTVIDQLAASGLTSQGPDGGSGPKPWRRVVIEKPFGNSLASAKALNARILRTLSEDQIFRIDHFLGKDTVQSIMAFRFANGLFEPIWNRNHIDQVQITAAETVGVEKRGKFYEATGALRDMVPNHVLTLLSMVAMEPPVGFDEASVRTKKADVFAAMPPVRPEHAVRGQYDGGTVLGKSVRAYRAEPDVAGQSDVETFAALRFEIDNWRWAGVPFFVRTGKHLSQRKTEIAICFKQAPYAAFQDTPVEELRSNWLVLRIAPDEGISLQFEIKRPGPAMNLAAVKMDFKYDDWFPKEPNVGYETLLHDIMMGDPTLFMRADMVEQAWRIVQPVLDAWAHEKPEFPNYASGSEGPSCANKLLTTDGNRSWRPVGPIPEQKA